MNKALKELLGKEMDDLKNACDSLEYSYDRCCSLTIRAGLDYETMERFEALTARFARLSDIMIQKFSEPWIHWILKTVEPSVTALTVLKSVASLNRRMSLLKSEWCETR